MYSIIRKKSSAAAGASGAAFTCGTFHRYDRRLLRASGTPLCRAAPSLSSPLAEPCVMVNVMFHKLLDIFLGAALVLGSGLLHFRLQLGRNMHFHIFLA